MTAREKNMALRPGFFRSLRGIWLLTWKTQLTWRRMPGRIIGLLVLPLLVFLTTSPRVRSHRSPILGSPDEQVNLVSRSLKHSGHPLQPEQESSLRQILSEEFATSENDFRQSVDRGENPAQSGEIIKSCFKRINSRARGALDESQLSEFQRVEQRHQTASERRAKDPDWGPSATFYHLLVDFYFFVILPLTCVGTCGALIRDELQADTLGFLTTRPLSRSSLLLTKFLCQSAWLQIIASIQVLLLFTVGIYRHIPSIASLIPLFLGIQFLAVLAWSALGALLGLITKRYIAMALVYGAIVEMGIGRIPTNINTLSMMRHLKTLLAHNPALQSLYDWQSTGTPFSIIALLVASMLFLAASAFLFTFMEYHYTAEMQK